MRTLEEHVAECEVTLSLKVRRQTNIPAAAAAAAAAALAAAAAASGTCLHRIIGPLQVKDLRDLNAAMAEKEAEKKKFIEQANAKSTSIQGSIDSTMELLDGLKTDVANLNGELNEKRAAEAGLTEKTETDDQKIDIMKQTQAEKEAMVSQLETAGVENTEQIAELEEASTQLAAELDEVLKTIEESRAKIDKYTSERAGQKSAVPPNLKKK